MPIWAIDQDGLEAWISTKPNHDGSTQITINIDLKVKNSTGQSQSTIEKMATGVKNLLESELQGFDNESNSRINTVVNLTYDNNASFDNDINNESNDFFLDFVPRVQKRGVETLYSAGWAGSSKTNANANDWIGNTDFNRFQNIVYKGRKFSAIFRTGAHEVLHGLGIYHADDDDNDIEVEGNDNLSYQTRKSTGTSVNLDQLKRIIEIAGGDRPSKGGRFNKKTKRLNRQKAVRRKIFNASKKEQDKRRNPRYDPSN